MAGTLAAMAAGLATVVSWPMFGFVIVGTLIGVVFGAVPGLGGVIALALLIPITFGMEPTAAMILFGATLGGVSQGGSISAILINVPGTAPNAATIFDGYPMTRQGRAGEALGISSMASALGAIFGLFILVLMLPVARRLILAFSPPEFFWLAVLGLTVIAVTSRGRLLKGLVAGGVGLMLSFIGINIVTGFYRYGFGTLYLWDGLQLVPALIGIFAVAEVIDQATKGGVIASEEQSVESRGGVFRGAMTVLRHPVSFLRASATGMLIGMVPGVGGTVANFIAYMQALQTADDPESFGQGNPIGVIASEAANDSKDGGALLPTILFGIPGSAAMTVLLGGFILHGLNPGRQLLNEGLPVLFTLIFALLFSNVISSLLVLGMADWVAKITRVKVTLIIPAILVVSLVGSFAIRNSLGDVMVTLLFGFVGYAMLTYDFSRIALVIALILGPIAERAFLQSRMISDVGYLIFVTRPISLILIVLTVLTLLLPFIRARGAESSASVGGGD